MDVNGTDSCIFKSQLPTYELTALLKIKYFLF